MKYNKTLVLTAALAATTLSASAQALRSAYFSDSYLFRHKMNPALANDDGYFAMPILGNTSIDVGRNFGVSDFVKPGPGGKLVTSLHPSVSASDFLDGLDDKLKMQEAIDFTILDIGINAWEGYNYFSVGMHEMAGIQLPKDLLSFMKEMNPGKTYQFSDMHVGGRAWVDVAIGHSREIISGLRVGVKAKILLGLVYGDLNLNGAEATFGDQKWRMKLNGDLTAGMHGARFTTDADGNIDGIDDSEFGVAGKGWGIDLGVSYDMKRWVNGLKLSAALTDLGSINWTECATAYNAGQPFEFDGFQNVSVHDQDGANGRQGSLSQQWESISDDLEKMANFKEGKMQDVSESLAPTLTLGAEYEIPVYKKVSFGLLYTQRFSDFYDFNEVRLSCNYAPALFFDMAVSASTGTWGNSFGGVLNLHLSGLNLFVGTDYVYTGTVNKDYIPLDKSGINVQFGLNFPVGRSKK